MILEAAGVHDQCKVGFFTQRLRKGLVESGPSSQVKHTIRQSGDCADEERASLPHMLRRAIFQEN